MTSSRRRPDRPIESVELTVSFRADRETSKKIREEIPSVKARGSGLVLKVSGTRPEEVEGVLRGVLEKVREIEGRAQVRGRSR